jgi:polyisoprenoid-binding protein YceI
MGEAKSSPMKHKQIAALCGLLGVVTPTYAATLTVDKEKSSIQVDVKSTGHDFAGALSDYKATVEGDGKTLQPTAVNLTWKFTDLKTGENKRDAEMLKWLGAAVPEGSFRFTKFWMDGGKTCAMGELTIHGISKSVGFAYTAKKDGNSVTIDGTVPINYENFGLPIIRNFAVMKVDPALVVKFHLVGEAK